MSFLKGSVSLVRYAVGDVTLELPPPPDATCPEDIDLARLRSRQIGSSTVLAPDGSDWGWTAGAHVLDKDFAREKNIIEDSLIFAMRNDTNKPPASMMQAYAEIDLKVLAVDNPSGRPSAKQKREAKAMARDRLEQEAKDGRFIKRKAVDMLWHNQSKEFWAGTTSGGFLERTETFFLNTFGCRLSPLNAHTLALRYIEERAINDLSPSRFESPDFARELAWEPDELSRKFLGNEFLLWLWWHCEQENDTFILSDDSDAAVMFGGKLRLECSRGQTGNEEFASTNPTKLPEARRGIQSGKLPRKAGLVLVRHDQQYHFTLQAETFAVSGAKLPKLEEETDSDRRIERVQKVRHLIETLDLLYSKFLGIRVSDQWKVTEKRMAAWLRGDFEEKRAAI